MLFCRLCFERKYFSYFTSMKMVWLRQAKSCSAVYTSTLKCQCWYFSVTSLFLLRNALKKCQEHKPVSFQPHLCRECICEKKHCAAFALAVWHVFPWALPWAVCREFSVSSWSTEVHAGVPQSLAVVADWIKHLSMQNCHVNSVWVRH